MITVALESVEELFTAPVPDPFVGRFEHTTGADRILATARRSRPRQEKQAVVLRTSRRTRYSEREVTAALAGYWRSRIADVEEARRKIWNRGFKELAVGALFLAACLALSASLSTVDWQAEWVGQFITEGLVIVGWIALWHPVDMLLFEPWPLNADLRAMRRLAKAPVRIEVGSARTGTA